MNIILYLFVMNTLTDNIIDIKQRQFVYNKIYNLFDENEGGPVYVYKEVLQARKRDI